VVHAFTIDDSCPDYAQSKLWRGTGRQGTVKVPHFEAGEAFAIVYGYRLFANGAMRFWSFK